MSPQDKQCIPPWSFIAQTNKCKWQKGCEHKSRLVLAARGAFAFCLWHSRRAVNLDNRHNARAIRNSHAAMRERECGAKLSPPVGRLLGGWFRHILNSAPSFLCIAGASERFHTYLGMMTERKDFALRFRCAVMAADKKKYSLWSGVEREKGGKGRVDWSSLVTSQREAVLLTIVATESEQSLSSSHPNLSFLIFPFSHVQAPRTIFSLFSLSLYNIMNKKAAAAAQAGK